MVLAIQQTSIYFGTANHIVPILKVNIFIFLLVLDSLLLFLLLLGGVLDPVLHLALITTLQKSRLGKGFDTVLFDSTFDFIIGLSSVHAFRWWARAVGKNVLEIILTIVLKVE